jgi:predicted DNA-binding protein
MPKDQRIRFAKARRGAGQAVASRKPGRPASGPGGEKVSEYPAVMIRLPQHTRTTLAALSAVTGTPVWQIVDRAVTAYIQQLSRTERRLIADVKMRRAQSRKES